MTTPIYFRRIPYFNPRSPHGERLEQGGWGVGGRCISIHALLTESDGCSVSSPKNPCGFQSTLSSRRATSNAASNAINAVVFQSTLSSRRATTSAECAVQCAPSFQSTLSSRRATISGGVALGTTHISIHALLTESDHTNARRHDGRHYFNPRSPHGERRCRSSERAHSEPISIHALLTESDVVGGIYSVVANISIHALLTESDSKYHQIGPIVSV